MPRLLVLILTAVFATAAQAKYIQGVVNPGATGDIITFRAGKDDYTLDLSKMDAQTAALLRAPEAQTTIGPYDVPFQAIVDSKHVENGLRSDCSELPMSMADLDKIVDRGDVNDIVSFLREIPEGSMQSYTYVINSLSAQKGEGEHKVRPEYPRVLRGSIDGKITFSWTCDPEDPAYNTVEVLYYENNELKTRSYELDKPAGSRGPAGRIEYNPTSCATCHSTGVPINGKLSLKHNWAEYFTWGDCQLDRGVSLYGMVDDSMKPGVFRRTSSSSSDHRPSNCGGVVDEVANEAQQRLYQKFKQEQADNPCYNLLPKPDEANPKRDGLDYSYYPYHAEKGDGDSGLSDYSLETNTRFTDVYAHLNTARIFELLKKSPDYEKMKYYLIMEEAGCLNKTDLGMIDKIMPGLDTGKERSERTHTDPSRSNPILYSFSLKAGLQPADWSLEYKTNTNYTDPTYNSVMPSETRSYDMGMADVVPGQMLRDLAGTESSLQPIADKVMNHGIGDQFGERHSCLDKLGSGIDEKHMGRSKDLCRELHRLNNLNLEKCRGDICSHLTEPKAPERAIDETSAIFAALALDPGADTAASVERGRRLVQSPDGKAHCIKCHSRTPENIQKMPERMLFMPGETLSPSDQTLSKEMLKQRAGEGFFKSVEDQLGSGNMPYDTGFENPLSAQDVKDVENYMKSLIAQ